MTEKVQFTFFPDPEDQLYFSEASVAELGETITDQPDIIARVIHETRRHHKIGILYMALQKQHNSGSFLTLESDAIQDAFESAVYMCSEFNQTREEARRFVLDTLGIIAKLKEGLEIDALLDPRSQKNVNDSTDLMMCHVERGIKEAKACLN